MECINKFSVDMKKACFFIARDDFGSSAKDLIDRLRDAIASLVDREYQMFYIVMDGIGYNVIQGLVDFVDKGVFIVTKEFNGDDSGGFFVSLAPIINMRDRVLTIYGLEKLEEKLLDLADLIYPEFRYNIAFLDEEIKTDKPVYVHLRRNKLIKKFSRKEGSNYFFKGIMLMRGSLYKWMERRIHKRPVLAGLDFTEALNDYISSGGRVYGYIIP